MPTSNNYIVTNVIYNILRRHVLEYLIRIFFNWILIKFLTLLRISCRIFLISKTNPVSSIYFYLVHFMFLSIKFIWDYYRDFLIFHEYCYMIWYIFFEDLQRLYDIRKRKAFNLSWPPIFLNSPHWIKLYKKTDQMNLYNNIALFLFCYISTGNNCMVTNVIYNREE